MKAPRNRTLSINAQEAAALRKELHFVQANTPLGLDDVTNRLLCADSFQTLQLLPPNSFDLLFADPPYNLTKTFGKERFSQTNTQTYENWLDSWLQLAAPLLKQNASIYICGDWRSGSAIERASGRYFKLRNRITWEREKGRGAKANWKNSAEDIWYFTVSDDYTFNVDAVKQRRRVLAP